MKTSNKLLLLVLAGLALFMLFGCTGSSQNSSATTQVAPTTPASQGNLNPQLNPVNAPDNSSMGSNSGMMMNDSASIMNETEPTIMAGEDVLIGPDNQS